jgi:lipopolysaccharide biosynthesis glycosyltransferase/glycosyltransferase involved in cell wall biosynthesis
MKRIAIVVHRYGKEIGSGAEYLAMQYAERLSEMFEVHVLTTTCLDYESWDNHYPPGKNAVAGVTVIRFSTEHGRVVEEFAQLSNMQYAKIQCGEPTNEATDGQWIDLQGPYCPSLLEYIAKNRDSYEAILFMTYLYYTTVRALPLVAEKAIFFPTAHDEPWIRQTIFQDLFSLPKYFGFLTNEEELFVRGHFHNSYIPGDVIGSGVEFPFNADSQRFRRKYGINTDYIVYIGRIDSSKNCDQMIDYFIQYKNRRSSDLKLVLIGSGAMDISTHTDIVRTGFICEEDKYDGISGALVTICPSKSESLCISLLESLAGRVPVLVNGDCSVLKAHCLISNAGLFYSSRIEFEMCLDYLVSHASERQIMGENGERYVTAHYSWERVIEKLCTAVERIQGNPTVDVMSHHGEDKSHKNQKNMVSQKANKNRDIYSDGQCKATVIHAVGDIALEPVFPSDSVVVLFVSSEMFSNYLGVLINSIIMNADPNRKYDLIVLKTDMSIATMNLISGLSNERANVSIRFVDVNQLIEDVVFKVSGENYDNYTFYRLLLPDLMRKYAKVLYLDSDVLANADIAELFDTDIDGYDLAATFDGTVACWQTYNNDMRRYFQSIGLAECGKYFQAGVVLFNIAQMNSKFERDFLIRSACEKHYILNDQDLLNIYCKDHVKYVDQAWNVFVLKPEAAAEWNRNLPESLYAEIIKSRRSPKIIHYTEKQFPCLVPDADMGHYYWQYARDTPFYEKLLHKMKAGSNKDK